MIRTLFALLTVASAMSAGTCESMLGSYLNFTGELDENSAEEINFTVPQLIRKYDYNVSTHYITTDDGYILEMHRIPGSPSSPPCKGKPPVLLMHGLAHSSAIWVLMRPSHGLGYLLADQGYDVWMGNFRGNRYSRRHATLDPDGDDENRRKFWDFSWHEMGIHDLPEMIDYILLETGKTKLNYIGHSQGATAFFVMCTERPEYNNKVILANLLAPAVFLNPAANPSVQRLSYVSPMLESVRQKIELYEFPSNEYYGSIGKNFCYSPFTRRHICGNIFTFFENSQSNQINEAMLPIIMGHIPAGSSSKQGIHFVQLVYANRFQQFDHGEIENLNRYNDTIPPEYNLRNVNVKVSLHYAKNDGVISAENVERLNRNLLNVVSTQVVQYDQFDHRDYIFSVNVREMLYDNIINDIKQTNLIDQLENNSLNF